MEDKTVQRAVASIVEALYEEDFLKSSYGYRPGRGAKDAVSEVTRQLPLGRFRWVVEADIQGFFDHINHEQLMGMPGERIQDGRFLRLIRKWLKAGIPEATGAVINPETGTRKAALSVRCGQTSTCYGASCLRSRLPGLSRADDDQWEFFRQITGILFKWLHRRSQRTSYTRAGLADRFKRYAVPQPGLTEPNNG
jgi:hypothetical protein